MRILTALSRLSLAAAIACGLVSSLPALASTSFTVVGPGGGGAMFHPTISPYDTREALIACDMTGSYITHDGGNSWRMFNLRGAVRLFAFDPVRRGVLYAANNALWRSTDDGATWHMLLPRPSAVQHVGMDSDHAEVEIDAEPDPMGIVRALAIDPADGRRLFVATEKSGQNALWESTDDGAHWTQLTVLSELALSLWIDPRSPRTSRTLYVAGSEGLHVREGGQWSQRRGPAGVHFADITAGFSATGSLRLAAVASDRIFLSADAGRSWQVSTLQGSGATLRAVATSLNHPEAIYVSYGHLQQEGKSWQGVARSADGGLNWNLVWHEDDAPAANLRDAWINSEMGPNWPENPLALGVAPIDPDFVYGTDFGRTLRTTDGGATWQGIYARRVGGGEWQNTGLNVTTNYGYLFDPFDRKRQFIPTTDIGLFRSEDGGRSWIRSMSGVPDAWQNTCYWLVFDPEVQGKVWGAMSEIHDLPRPKMWRHTNVDTYTGGVSLSLDGGKSWKTSNAGMPESAVTHILLDPSSPVGRRTLWATAMGRGVFKSVDDGKTWGLSNKGIAGQQPLAWRMARAQDGTLYLIVARRSEDGSIGNSGDGALYRSMDGAASWTPVPLPAETNGPSGLAIDPENPQRMHLALWGRPHAGSKSGGVYLTEDGGKTWRQTLDRDQHVYDVTIDPTNAHTLYAAGFESSAWRSLDSGEHWQRIEGFNFMWAHRVIVDPVDPKMIYVSTFGGGVWHGPAAGGEGHIDIATPNVQPIH